MASLADLQDTFSRGQKRDFARNQMPKGSVYAMVDLIPNLGAPLRGRGGYTYASADINATTATQYIIGGIYAGFAAGAKNLAINEVGRLVRIVSSSSTTDIGAAVTVAQNPVFHRDKVVIPASDGTTAPKYYDGTTLGNLGGSPPAAVYATVYKDRTLLARSSANKERVWFSGPGDPASWDTTNSYWDISFPISGLAALRNAILVFSEGHVSRLRGATPPTSFSDGDITADDPIFEVGCTDARSIALYGDNAVFANPGGIWLTDGAAVADLTSESGNKTYWQELLTGYDSGWTIVGAVYRDYYMCGVLNGSTFKDFILIDIPRRVFTRFANIKARCMWRAVTGSEELYFGLRSLARVGSISSAFMPSASVKNDGDGTAVTPLLETGFYEDKPARKGWRKVYVAYDLRDAASDNPTLTVSYIRTPEETSYTALTPTLAETTTFDRKRVSLGFNSYGLALKIQQANASSDFRLYSIQAEVHEREMSRL